MGGLKMPQKGKGAAMLQELNAEHAPSDDKITTNDVPTERTLDETNVTTLQGNKTDSKPTAEYLYGLNVSADVLPIVRETFSAHPADRETRMETALRRAAEDEIAVVTVRISTRLNQYMDEYVTRINRIDPKRRYRKQDAIAEAFAAFYAEHPLPALPADEEL